MKLLSLLKTFLSKFFKTAIQQQIDIILPVAIDAVKQISEDPSILTSEEKRQRAIAIIIAELTSKEIIFAKRIINLCVEIAVVSLKGIE